MFIRKFILLLSAIIITLCTHSKANDPISEYHRKLEQEARDIRREERERIQDQREEEREWRERRKEIRDSGRSFN